MREPDRDPGRIKDMPEAANMLTDDFKSAHSEIPWKQVIKMRHVLVHGYSNILPEILWETAKQDVPLLKEMLLKL